MTHPAVWAGFGRHAAAYERGRPDYPVEAVAWLAERLSLEPGRCVVDLGAGTGKLTRRLVATGARVVAVEPADGMRAELVRAVPGVEAIAGIAEELPLADASADAVTAAQSFHWFANERALAEIARVLRPGGRLGLVWNTRDLADPVQRALVELIEPLRTTEHSHVGSGWRAALEASTDFGPVEEERFANLQRVDADLLADRVGSVSFVAVLSAEERAPVLERARALAGGGELDLRYVTEVFAVERSDRGRTRLGTL